MKINLHSFVLPLLPQANLSFPKVSHLLLSSESNFQNYLSRRIDNSLDIYLFLNFELGKSEEFNNPEMKENRAFRSYCFYNRKKKHTSLSWNFLKTTIHVYRGASTLYFNILLLFSVNPCCLKISQPHIRINKMVNSVDYPSCVSRTNV